MFIQQVLNFTVGMINTMMVSRAGEAAVSGVSLVNTLDNVLIVFFTALVAGGSVVVAQVLGTKKTKQISDVAKQLIISHAVVAMIIYPFGFLTPAIFQAASDVRFTMVVSMLSMWVLRVGLGYVLALETISVFGFFTISGFGLGIWGVWIVMLSDWILRAVIYMIRYLTGRWLKVRQLVH